MPFQRTPAVCLRRIDYSETSQVLRFFSPAYGKVSCIAKGSKRRRGSFSAPFELLGLYDLVRIEKRPGTLDIVTQAERVRTFLRLREDYGRYAAACYGAEFVDEFTAEGMPVGGLFERLVELLERLDGDVPLPDALYSFEARALGALGFLPRARECGGCRRGIRRAEAFYSARDGGALCGECRPRNERGFPVSRASLESVARFGEGQMPRESMKQALVQELRQIFDASVRYHLERELKSARFVRDAVAASPNSAPVRAS